MHTLKKATLWTCALIGLVALLAPVPRTAADPWVRTRNGKSKEVVKWRNADGSPKRTLTVYINPKAGGQFKKDVKAAMDNWNNAGVGWTFREAKGKEKKAPDVTVTEGNPPGSALGVCDDKKGKGKDGTGSAQKGGQVVTKRMDITIDKNGGSRGWEQPHDDQDTKDQKWNRERIIKHELGHALGIDHTKDTKTHVGDIMEEGTTQDSAGDTTVLTAHDKAEAKGVDKVDPPPPTSTIPGHRRTGVPSGGVRIVGGAGARMTLGEVVGNPTLTAIDPGELTIDYTGHDAAGIDADVTMVDGASTWQGYLVDVEYATGELATYAGWLVVGPDEDDPAKQPHAVYSGLPVEQHAPGDPIVLDGSASSHDIPEESVRMSRTWHVDGVRALSEGHVELTDLEPGQHLARLVVIDRWGRQSEAEKTLVVGTPVTNLLAGGPGGVSPDLIIEPVLSERGVAFAIAGIDPFTGDVYYGESDGTSIASELVAPAGPGSVHVSAALDPSSGQVHLAWHDAAAQGLVHGVRDGGTWLTEILPDSDGGDDGAFCQIAVGHDGVVHAVYLDSSPDGTAWTIQHAVRSLDPLAPEPWTVESLAPALTPFPWIAMELNGLSRPNVAWTEQGPVWFATRTPGGAWDVELVAVDASPNPDSMVDLEIGGWDEPVITYASLADDPVLARHDGVEWVLEPTLPLLASPLMFATSVDEADDVHVAYLDLPGAPGAPVSVWYLTRIGGEWSLEELGADTGAPEVAGIAIDLTHQHLPCAAYLGVDEAGDLGLHVACREVPAG